MKFFIPELEPTQYEEAYRNMRDAVHDQMRTTITERRIRSISYLHDKKRYVATVGETMPKQDRFEVMAIYESKPYVIFTRTKSGGQGVTILVNQDEITDIEEFA